MKRIDSDVTKCRVNDVLKYKVRYRIPDVIKCIESDVIKCIVSGVMKFIISDVMKCIVSNIIERHPAASRSTNVNLTDCDKSCNFAEGPPTLTDSLLLLTDAAL